MQDLLAAINAAGASQISFNAVTKPNIQKALQQVGLRAGFSLPADTLTSIADSANGDLRNAIETLQLAAAGAPIDTQAVKGQTGKVSVLVSCMPVKPAMKCSSYARSTAYVLHNTSGQAKEDS